MANTRFLAGVAAISMVFGMGGVAHAQDAQAQPGVARVSFIHGQVSMQRGDSGDWVATTLNTPLVGGDSISTGPNSRAEVQLDYATVLRLDSNSTAKIAALSRDSIVVQAGQGLVNLDVLTQDSAPTEVDTPNMSVHPNGNGEYRVEVDSNDLTKVTVWKGEADISTPQGSTRVESGQMITVQGTDNPEYQTAEAPSQDDWDQWNRDRDRHIGDAKSWRYTDRYYTGSGDLDAYGHWVYVPDYGQVWQPEVAGGWAPYRDGRWVWEPFYGWTWVSYEPWGWAPYHYGRWLLYDDAWCWWPGPIGYYPNYYPIWAPAYVSFFGFGYAGGGWSFGFGFGNVGWLPLGPADWFYPWYGGGFGISFVDYSRFRDRDWDHDGRYRYSPLYGGRGGFSNVGLAWKDPQLRRGISSMPYNDFGRAPVPRRQQVIADAQFNRSRVFTGSLPIIPDRASLRVSNRQPSPSTIRNGIDKQRFFNGGHAAPAQRSFQPRSFEQQRSQMQRMVQNFRSQPNVKTATEFGMRTGGQPINSPAVRGRANAGSIGQPGVGSAKDNGQNMRQFGNPGSARPIAPAQQRQQPGSAWRTFGSQGQGQAQRGGSAWQEQGRQPNQVQHQLSNTWQNRNPGQAARPVAPAPAQRQGNWRTFSPSSGSQPQYRPYQGPQRGTPAPTQRQSGPRQFNAPARQPSQPNQARPNSGRPGPGGRQNWQTFSPSSQQPRAAPPARGGSDAPAQQRGGWSHFTPSSHPSAGQQGGREPLNLRQPIVQRRPPNSGNGGTPHSFYGGGPSYGRSPAYRSSPSYGGGSPSYSAPRGNYGYGGGRTPTYSSPRGNYGYGGGAPRYSAPRGNYGYGGRAPSYSAPRGSFGGYGGGGGPRYSAPRGGGGGRTYSAPRGGSGSRGGGSRGGGGSHPHGRG